MRLWSIDPQYLDWKGLGAEWREGLLAQTVLRGLTKGWKSHPQLDRFKAHTEPVAAISYYLLKVQEEATARGYNYDASKIVESAEAVQPLPITDGQLRYELDILMGRLERRAPEKFWELEHVDLHPHPDPHPLFVVVEGAIEPWETGYWKSKRAP
ncbi:MAG: pyrimidine dimer DNA glycosylase/endonuclease V [Candidatus Bathyarchaeota archaeon]